MIQTATINQHQNGINNNGNSTGNIHGKIITRSPNSSPNKLNATKKPMINNHNSKSYFTMRNRGSTSPTIKCTTTPNNNFISNYNSNPSIYSQTTQIPHNINPAIKNPPLINSNGYDNRSSPLFIPNVYQRGKYCQNHPNKMSNYIVQADDGQYGYCQKCAINLASRGITVTKKQDKLSMRNNNYLQNDINIFEQHKLSPFYGNKFVGIYGYSQINKFISQIQSIHTSYLNQIHKYQTIQQHYQHQYLITQQFYQNLISLIDQMRQDHLIDLQIQAKKQTQIAYIKQDHLKSDLNQVQIIRSDIVKQIQNILQRFDQPQIQHGLNQYKLQALLFKSKIQQENIEFQEQLINQKQYQLQKRLKLIEQYLLNIWNDKNMEDYDYRKKQISGNNDGGGVVKKNNQRVTQDKSPKNIKNIINIGEKVNNGAKNQGGPSTAYRKLFDDENENGENGFSEGGNMNGGKEINENAHIKVLELPIEQNNKQIASPQFKNI